jgi:hypothetical protein
MDNTFETAALQFSDGGSQWASLPPWARYLIGLGQSWPHISDGKRRVALISMPCESAAAGLIALGALRKRLEFPGADDRNAHFERIRSVALQGQGTVEIFDLRRKGKRRGPYFLDGAFDEEKVWARLRSSPDLSVTVSPATAAFWQFDGEPPVEVLDGQRLPYGPLYATIPGALAPVVEDNLSHSDSDICLAGRTAGEASTRKAMDELRFRNEHGPVASLADLLTIHSWQGATVSRLVLFNTRTERADRSCRVPRLVLADGDLSFLGALRHFDRSDLVGVVSRTADRERLEMVGAKLVDMLQWFEGDEALALRLPPLVPGIALSVLRER